MSVRSKCRGASTARAKLQVMQHAGRRMEKVPARPRQPDARAMPLEDRNSQLALDLRDTTADRRRFNPRRQRGSTNVECLGHIDERAEISEFPASARRARLMPKRSIARSIDRKSTRLNPRHQ